MTVRRPSCPEVADGGGSVRGRTEVAENPAGVVGLPWFAGLFGGVLLVQAHQQVDQLAADGMCTVSDSACIWRASNRQSPPCHCKTRCLTVAVWPTRSPSAPTRKPSTLSMC